MRDDSSGSSMIWPATPVAEDVTGAILGAEAAVVVAGGERVEGIREL